MNSTIFEEVLRELDGYFKAKNKKILLLVDNASSHFNLHYLLTEQDVDNDEETESISGKF